MIMRKRLSNRPSNPSQTRESMSWAARTNWTFRRAERTYALKPGLSHTPWAGTVNSEQKKAAGDVVIVMKVILYNKHSKIKIRKHLRSEMIIVLVDMACHNHMNYVCCRPLWGNNKGRPYLHWSPSRVDHSQNPWKNDGKYFGESRL